MSFRTDQGGLATRAEIKVSTQVSTWNTRLAQLLRENTEVTICTFSLPRRSDALVKLFDKRSKGVTIIANSKFETEARTLETRFPHLRIILSPRIHAKMALAAPDKVGCRAKTSFPARTSKTRSASIVARYTTFTCPS